MKALKVLESYSFLEHKLIFFCGKNLNFMNFYNMLERSLKDDHYASFSLLWQLYHASYLSAQRLSLQISKK